MNSRPEPLLLNIIRAWRRDMLGQTHFVIFKRESRYSITECNSSGIRQAFICKGTVMGDENVLKHLSKMKQEHETIENFVENNAGCLVLQAANPDKLSWQ